MSLIACRNSIIGVLETYTGAPPIFAENVTVPKATFQGEWARWSIRMADIADSEIGALKERGVGTIYFQHYKPEGTGTKEAWDFADKLGAMFNRKKAGTAGVVTFERAVCQYMGPTDGAIQHNVTIAFRWGRRRPERGLKKKFAKLTGAP